MAAPPIAERHKMHFHRKAPVLESVRAATTANITIATALNNGDVLDGITLATDDRVLVKDQTTASGNGIYLVAAVPVRDYDVSSSDPGWGYLVRVRQGTVNAATLWANTNTSAPTIDTTALTFASTGGTDLSGIDFLVGTASALLSGEIVVGTTPGGELGGTWPSPTVDASHSGSTHAATQAAAEATAAAALAAHAGAAAVSDHQHIGGVTFSGDAVTTAFELPAAPFDAYSIDAYVAGTRTEVTLSGTLLTTMTFAAAPASGTDNIKVHIVAVAV